jgi:tetratricopeptide (TPR) repeat protein
MSPEPPERAVHRGDATTGRAATGESGARFRLIHRQIIQLVLLGLVAVAAFFLTRAIAINNREMNLRDGAEWYERGQQQLARGDLDDAIDSFRRASVRNPGNRRYVLALAHVLARTGHDDLARATLLTLRDSAPEDPEINLELARLAVQRQDVTEALRFYHNALYAPWPADQAEARRRVRLELINFLLTHDQTNRALSELLALTADLPDQAPAHIMAGQLFLRAGDTRGALDQFQRALRLAPADDEALAGAGQAAFRQADYSLARRYLRAVFHGTDEIKATREIAELVLSEDPLANRIGSVERRRRVLAAYSHATARLDACLQRREADGQPVADELALQQQAVAFEQRLKPAIHENETTEAGVDLIYRIERDVIERCPPATPRDQALIVIGREHGADQR